MHVVQVELQGHIPHAEQKHLAPHSVTPDFLRFPPHTSALTVSYPQPRQCRPLHRAWPGDGDGVLPYVDMQYHKHSIAACICLRSMHGLILSIHPWLNPLSWLGWYIPKCINKANTKNSGRVHFFDLVLFWSIMIAFPAMATPFRPQRLSCIRHLGYDYRKSNLLAPATIASHKFSST